MIVAVRERIGVGLMSEWVLVIFIWAGPMAKGDSVSMLSVPVASKHACEREGASAEALVRRTAKEYRYVCLHTE